MVLLKNKLKILKEEIMVDKKFLLLDDDSDVTPFFHDFCAAEGAKLLACESLIECVGKYDTFNPDLIFLDLSENDDTTLDFLKFRSTIPELVEIPIILISSDTKPEIVKECINYGIKDIIKKPIESFSVLTERLENIEF